MLQTLVAGLMVLAAGLAFSILGYQLFRLLLPIWGFIFGFFFGGLIASAFVGESVLGGPVTAFSALGLGIVLAILANRYYRLGILLISASIGALAIGLLLLSLSIVSETLLLVAVLVSGIILSVAGYYWHVWRYYIIVITSAIGASAIVSGVMLILGRITVYDLWNHNALGNVLRESLVWLLLWIAALGVGIYIQLRYTPEEAIEAPAS